MARLMAHSRRLLVAAALLIGLSGCTPSPVTVEGGQVKTLYDIFLVAAAAVFVVVAGLIGWSIVRYRAPETSDGGLPPQTRANLRLELVWWALPTLLVIGLFILSAQVLGEVDHQADAGALRVRVEGFQWQWRFTYETSGVQVSGAPDRTPQLVLPVGRQVAFDLVSDDVNHAFFVPRFLIKRDVIPGLTNQIRLTIDRAGTYAGQCAEFCGLYHDQMLFTIRAVPPAEFDAWLARQAAPSPTP